MRKGGACQIGGICHHNAEGSLQLLRDCPRFPVVI